MKERKKEEDDERNNHGSYELSNEVLRNCDKYSWKKASVVWKDCSRFQPNCIPFWWNRYVCLNTVYCKNWTSTTTTSAG